jgi:hypothetical protein
MPRLSPLSYGIESSFCKVATARSGSPICADTRARISNVAGPFHRVFFDRDRSHRLVGESEGGSLVTKAHIGQREIAKKGKIFRLFLEERFQFAPRLSPIFLGGGMVTADFLRPA